MDFTKLIKRGTIWEFIDEAELETFVGKNLQQLLKLVPIKR
ncbi:hypothetical protein NUACC26_002160 [Scytonema sp. NUACC26]